MCLDPNAVKKCSKREYQIRSLAHWSSIFRYLCLLILDGIKSGDKKVPPFFSFHCRLDRVIALFQYAANKAGLDGSITLSIAGMLAKLDLFSKSSYSYST